MARTGTLSTGSTISLRLLVRLQTQLPGFQQGSYGAINRVNWPRSRGEFFLADLGLARFFRLQLARRCTCLARFFPQVVASKGLGIHQETSMATDTFTAPATLSDSQTRVFKNFID